MNQLFWGGGGGNFATSICFLRFAGGRLNPDIYLMKVITEVEKYVLDAHLNFCLPYLLCIRSNKNVMYFLRWNNIVSKKYCFAFRNVIK